MAKAKAKSAETTALADNQNISIITQNDLHIAFDAAKADASKARESLDLFNEYLNRFKITGATPAKGLVSMRDELRGMK